MNPITVNIFAAYFNCRPAGRSDLMKAPALNILIKLVDVMSLVRLAGAQLLDFCYSSIPVLILLLSTYQYLV